MADHENRKQQEVAYSVQEESELINFDEPSLSKVRQDQFDQEEELRRREEEELEDAKVGDALGIVLENTLNRMDKYEERRNEEERLRNLENEYLNVEKNHYIIDTIDIRDTINILAEERKKKQAENVGRE